MQILIEIGRRKGYVNTMDVNTVYPAPRRAHQHSLAKTRMNKLVFLGYFENPKIIGTNLVWEYKNDNKKSNT